MCRTHSATKTKILFLKWWWILIEKGHKVSESMTFSNFSRTFRNAEKSSKNNLNARWETAGANKTYKAQPQPKANQKENEPKRWLIFWIGERWVKVIGERGEPKRWIRKFLNLQKLSDSWFLNCLSYQHLLPIQKIRNQKVSEFTETFWCLVLTQMAVDVVPQKARRICGNATYCHI